MGVVLLVLTTAPSTGAWGSSVHHDQAITISTALKETPSMPENVRDNIDSDLIYSLSLAPDDWRNVTGEWGTWHWNMAENGRQQLEDIRDAWALGKFENAIARIGVALHFLGDVMYMPHNEGIRQYYENRIPPLGSEEPLWAVGNGESGKYFTASYYYDATHYANQQVEAYSDSDSAWYPLQPENYGERDGENDDGSLDWYLDHYLMGPTPLASATGDIDTSGYSTVYAIPEYIRECNPWDDPIIPGAYDKKLDNRWFYWVDTRDMGIAKQDSDNTIRITYNGVYRALRDGTRTLMGDPANFDTEIWPWPTTSAWLSLSDDLYAEGMDTERWYNGVTSQGSKELSEQNVSTQPSAALLVFPPIILAIVIISYVIWRKWLHEIRKTVF